MATSRLSHMAVKVSSQLSPVSRSTSRSRAAPIDVSPRLSTLTGIFRSQLHSGVVCTDGGREGTFDACIELCASHSETADFATLVMSGDDGRSEDDDWTSLLT
eukprot:6212416-Pleurochrysis_carterae.AAC.1